MIRVFDLDSHRGVKEVLNSLRRYIIRPHGELELSKNSSCSSGPTIILVMNYAHPSFILSVILSLLLLLLSIGIRVPSSIY